MISWNSISLTEEEQRFADFLKEHGWQLMKELVPAGEHEGETWDEYESVVMWRDRLCSDGRFYSWMLTANRIAEYGAKAWGYHLELANLGWERLLEEHGVTEKEAGT